MTPITYTLTPNDLTKGIRFGMLSHLRSRWWRPLIFLTIISAVVAGGVSYWIDQDLAVWFEIFWKLFVFYGASLVVMLLAIYYWLSAWRVRKQFRQMPALSHEQRVHWDETTFHLTSHNGETHYPFAEFHKICANEAMILLYPTDQMFFLLPRRIFADQKQFDDLTERARQSGAKWI